MTTMKQYFFRLKPGDWVTWGIGNFGQIRLFTNNRQSAYIKTTDADNEPIMATIEICKLTPFFYRTDTG